MDSAFSRSEASTQEVPPSIAGVSLRRFYALLLAFCSVLATAWWSIPSARPPFIPDFWSRAIITLAASQCIFLLIYFCAIGWISLATIAVARLVAGLASTMARMLISVSPRIAGLLLCFFAGAILLDWIGLAPALTTWSNFPSGVVSFFIVYAAGCLLGWYLLVGSFSLFARALPPDEVRRFGPFLARLLFLSPVLTALAQAASFVTSFLGLQILLSATVEETLWVNVAVPLPVNFEAREFLLQISKVDLIAMGASLLMSLVIFWFSTLAIASVRGGHPVHPLFLSLIVFLGLISTYTAFIMWNGEN